MRNRLAVGFLLVAALGACIFSKRPQKVVAIKMPAGSVVLADLAQTPGERSRGLSGRRRLPEDSGMLFIFDTQDDWSMWMKDMRFAIDIVYLGSDKRVSSVKTAVPAPEQTPGGTIVTVSGQGRYVLELPVGAAVRHGLKVGSQLVF